MPTPEKPFKYLIAVAVAQKYKDGRRLIWLFGFSKSDRNRNVQNVVTKLTKDLDKSINEVAASYSLPWENRTAEWRRHYIRNKAMYEQYSPVKHCEPLLMGLRKTHMPDEKNSSKEEKKQTELVVVKGGKDKADAAKPLGPRPFRLFFTKEAKERIK